MPLAMENPTPDKWKKTAEEFFDIWNFPNCIGALDGKHVIIQAPADSGSQFFNYKKTFSIVLLALVDAYYKFIAVNIGGYGRNSDGGLFASSKLVGDEAFSLKKYLLRSYLGSQIQEDRSKRILNYRLSRARRVSENPFGILSQKFQLYNRRLKSKPENADKIVSTTCILHNYLRDCRNIIQDFEHNHTTELNLQNFPRQGGSANPYILDGLLHITAHRP
ncbi:uncharacterized protein LOC128881174 [Hylaeus volcanicus]|uniref:uncharacterized protein LOC128881174 n=1 Tax=Hylaeus volcanicus TaxID=313075 RepID=UPI0023B7F160|nr:uncharacterized protein LOC128881174 [Hylaeus volcanicus]